MAPDVTSPHDGNGVTARRVGFRIKALGSEIEATGPVVILILVMVLVVGVAVYLSIEQHKIRRQEFLALQQGLCLCSIPDKADKLAALSSGDVCGWLGVSRQASPKTE